MHKFLNICHSEGAVIATEESKILSAKQRGETRPQSAVGTDLAKLCL